MIQLLQVTMSLKVKKKLQIEKPSKQAFPVQDYLDNEIGLSQSILKMFLECDYKFLYYLNLWDKPGKEENFFYGSCCHEILDNVYSSGKKPTIKKLEKYLDTYLQDQEEKELLDWITPQKLEYYRAVIVVVMNEYFKYYKADFKLKFTQVESNFDVEWNGFRMTGKRDGMFKKKGKHFLLENKTKSFIAEQTLEWQLELDFQNMYYMLSDWIERGKIADGVMYNVIRRPQLKLGANESLQNFSKRLELDIKDRPDFYFKRWDVEYSKKQVELFQFELYEILIHMDRMVTGYRPAIHNRANCNNGFPCDFLEACGTDSFKNYKKRKYLSPELV